MEDAEVVLSFLLSFELFRCFMAFLAELLYDIGGYRKGGADGLTSSTALVKISRCFGVKKSFRNLSVNGRHLA